MDKPILRCSLEDLAQVYSLQLNEFEPISLTQLGQAQSDSFNLKDLYVEAQQKIASQADNVNCPYVGCYQFTFLHQGGGYIAEAIGLKKK
jgi:hypothetical protein